MTTISSCHLDDISDKIKNNDIVVSKQITIDSTARRFFVYDYKIFEKMYNEMQDEKEFKTFDEIILERKCQFVLDLDSKSSKWPYPTEEYINILKSIMKITTSIAKNLFGVKIENDFTVLSASSEGINPENGEKTYKYSYHVFNKKLTFSNVKALSDFVNYIVYGLTERFLKEYNPKLAQDHKSNVNLLKFFNREQNGKVSSIIDNCIYKINKSLRIFDSIKLKDVGNEERRLVFYNMETCQKENNKNDLDLSSVLIHGPHYNPKFFSESIICDIDPHFKLVLKYEDRVKDSLVNINKLLGIKEDDPMDISAEDEDSTDSFDIDALYQKNSKSNNNNNTRKSHESTLHFSSLQKNLKSRLEEIIMELMNDIFKEIVNSTNDLAKLNKIKLRKKNEKIRITTIKLSGNVIVFGTDQKLCLVSDTLHSNSGRYYYLNLQYKSLSQKCFHSNCLGKKFQFETIPEHYVIKLLAAIEDEKKNQKEN